MKPFVILNEATMQQGLAELAVQDDDLGRLWQQQGTPPFWFRDPGFATLVHIILEQQVSLASARAAFDKLLVITAPLTPEKFSALDDVVLKQVGFSRQKTAYGRFLAHAILAGELDLEGLAGLENTAVRAELTKNKGIGNWTANIYLLMALRRADVWPSGDLAVAVAAQQVKGLPHRPKSDELDHLAAQWAPWRSVAARLLWQHYLSR